MSVYTVHEPPLRKGETIVSPERFAFVREGFHFWAFVLPPVWMLWHRLWLTLVLYLLIDFSVIVIVTLAGGSDDAVFIATALLGLLVGFEAATLRRWKLRKWKTVGTVVGRNLEEAERRFFAQWTGRDSEPAPVTLTAKVAPPPPQMPAPPRKPLSTHDVIGLFPEPGTPR